jgi:hypothetical protein
MEQDNSKRPETGPMQFGSDWPGVFIRGDNAGWWAFLLNQILDGEHVGPLNIATLRGLRDVLARCDVRSNPQNIQRAKLEEQP